MKVSSSGRTVWIRCFPSAPTRKPARWWSATSRPMAVRAKPAAARCSRCNSAAKAPGVARIDLNRINFRNREGTRHRGRPGCNEHHHPVNGFPTSARPGRQRGLTLIELVITLVILGILAAAALPMAEVAVDPRQGVRTAPLPARYPHGARRLQGGFRQGRGAEEDHCRRSTTPATRKVLEKLVEGNDWGGLYPYKRRYLRRIPVDPFDEYDEGWGLRSYQDDSGFDRLRRRESSTMSIHKAPGGP